ncbi:MAG: tetratricopeptide repeat protein [Gemmataceae bacterium]|nr:tetratricopeptide repeat protein [Gemmataceae bacterium]
MSLLSLGEAKLAVVVFEKAWATRQAQLGADHPDTLRSMNNLAGGYRDAGQLDKALPLFQEAAAGMERRRFRHQYAGWTVNNLIDCHERLQQFEQAEARRRKWLAHVKEQVGPAHPAYAGELAALGLLLLKQQKWAEAEAVLRECLAIREKAPGADSSGSGWLVFNTMSLLGEALLGQKKYAEAEPLLVKGYEGLQARQQSIPKEGQVRIPEALERLVLLYEAVGKQDEAAKWRKELEAAKKSAP